MSNVFRRMAASPAFGHFVTFVILAAGVVVGLETDSGFVARNAQLLQVLDAVILGIFVAELAVKLLAEWPRPHHALRDPWNVFDFLIVAASFLPLGGQHLVVLRLVRLLRVLRLVRALPRLQVLVSALIKSFPSMGYVSLLLGLLFYVYAVAGTFLFGGNDPVHFGSLQTSLLTLFRIVTLEGWSELLYIQMRGCDAFGYAEFPTLCTAPSAQPGAAVLFFTSFILMGTMVVLNLFIGVIMNGMTEATAEQRSERADAPGEEVAVALAQMEVKLTELQLQIARLRADHTGAAGGNAEAGGRLGRGLPPWTAGVR